MIRKFQKTIAFFSMFDEGFSLTKHLMRLYAHSSLIPQKNFNYKLNRARQATENIFDILALRWRIFRKLIIAKLDTVEKNGASLCMFAQLIDKGSLWKKW